MKDLDKVLELISEEVEPEEIAKMLGTSVCHATNLCLKLVEMGKLKLKFRVFCPKCGRVCADYEGIMEIPDEIECECGEIFMPTRDDIKMIFSKV